MRIYITDAQVPELAPFKPQVRRFLRQCAFQQMFSERPWLRWLPNGLCVVGLLGGVLTFPAFPQALYSWIGGRMYASLLFQVLVAALGGFVGSQILIHSARRYMRNLTSTHEA